MRKTVREFILSVGNSSINKSFSCVIISLRLCAASTYCAIAVHTGKFIIMHKTENQSAVCQCIFTVRMFMV
jgi:hypothetical protein